MSDESIPTVLRKRIGLLIGYAAWIARPTARHAFREACLCGAHFVLNSVGIGAALALGAFAIDGTTEAVNAAVLGGAVVGLITLVWQSLDVPSARALAGRYVLSLIPLAIVVALLDVVRDPSLSRSWNSF